MIFVKSRKAIMLLEKFLKDKYCMGGTVGNRHCIDLPCFAIGTIYLESRILSFVSFYFHVIHKEEHVVKMNGCETSILQC